MFPASISICLHCSHPLSHPLLRDSKGTYSREHWNLNTLLIFKKWANTGLFFVYFRSFQTNNTNFFNKYMWKNVHPVYGARIQTYDLWKSKVFSFIGKMHVKFYSSFYLPIPMFFTLSLSFFQYLCYINSVSSNRYFECSINSFFLFHLLPYNSPHLILELEYEKPRHEKSLNFALTTQLSFYPLKEVVVNGVPKIEFYFGWCQCRSVTRKNCQMTIKVAPKWFHLKSDIFWHLYKNA